MRPAAEPPADDVSFEPSKGWHVTHSFYAFDRSRLAALGPVARAEGCTQFAAALDPAAAGAPCRLQTWLVPGHKADFGVMAMDPSPFKVDDAHQRLLAGPLGRAVEPTYSFVGLTEVSEYVPTVEQFGERLITARGPDARPFGLVLFDLDLDVGAEAEAHASVGAFFDR
jgi:chlorite dismutase